MDLRDASMSVGWEFQAKELLDRLFNAIWQRQGSAYYALCAVEMLLNNGNEGLLNELLNPKNIQELAKYFDDRQQFLLLETQQLLAKYVYVRSFMKVFQEMF